MHGDVYRVYLRPIVHDDVRALHAVRGDPEVMIHSAAGLPSAHVDETQQWIERMLVARQPFFAICLASATDAVGTKTIVQEARSDSGDDVIGSIGLVTATPPEVGYSIRKDQWGNGYTSKALQAFCAWYETHLSNTDGAMSKDNVRAPLTAIVEEENKASQKVLKKAGFHPIPGERWTSKPDHRGELILLRYTLAIVHDQRAN